MEQRKLTAMMITHDVDESIYLADRVIMMTNGPAAGIGDILEINLSRPRDRQEIMSQEQY